MTLTLESVRKVAVIGFTVEGTDVELEVEGQEKRIVPNHGSADLFFPTDFTGTVTVTAQGTKPDSAADTGTISIP
jgi:hypothetical protein